ncbi:MAG: hypothetical protein ACYTXA_13150 [Nostoc sp.]
MKSDVYFLRGNLSDRAVPSLTGIYLADTVKYKDLLCLLGQLAV